MIDRPQHVKGRQPTYFCFIVTNAQAHRSIAAVMVNDTFRQASSLSTVKNLCSAPWNWNGSHALVALRTENEGSMDRPTLSICQGEDLARSSKCPADVTGVAYALEFLSMPELRSPAPDARLCRAYPAHEVVSQLSLRDHLPASERGREIYWPVSTVGISGLMVSNNVRTCMMPPSLQHIAYQPFRHAMSATPARSVS